VPKPTLSGLTAEDFRLLLNGCSSIDVRMLRSCTTFVNETGRASQEGVEQIRRWFWHIIERMSETARHDLVYFWTSSPALPATEAGFVPRPTIVIRPPTDSHLPTANTCVARLSIPLYSSRKVFTVPKCVQAKTAGHSEILSTHYVAHLTPLVPAHTDSTS